MVDLQLGGTNHPLARPRNPPGPGSTLNPLSSNISPKGERSGDGTKRWRCATVQSHRLSRIRTAVSLWNQKVKATQLIDVTNTLLLLTHLKILRHSILKQKTQEDFLDSYGGHSANTMAQDHRAHTRFVPISWV